MSLVGVAYSLSAKGNKVGRSPAGAGGDCRLGGWGSNYASAGIGLVVGTVRQMVSRTILNLS